MTGGRVLSFRIFLLGLVFLGLCVSQKSDSKDEEDDDVQEDHSQQEAEEKSGPFSIQDPNYRWLPSWNPCFSNSPGTVMFAFFVGWLLIRTFCNRCHRLLTDDGENNYFKVLGVPRLTSIPKIRSAFRHLVIKCGSKDVCGLLLGVWEPCKMIARLLSEILLLPCAMGLLIVVLVWLGGEISSLPHATTVGKHD